MSHAVTRRRWTRDVGAGCGRRSRRRAVAGVAFVALALSGCAATDDPTERDDDSGASARPSSPTGAPEPSGATVRPLPSPQWRAMRDAGMVRPGCPITTRDELRRVDLDYVDFNGQTQRGYLVVNADTAETTSRIFAKLFEIQFPIGRMQGLENYDGDTLASLRDNNTSAYNCRTPDQINAPFLESPHANGRAIDINPVQNPWMDLRCQCWSPGPENNARTPGPGKILRGGPVWTTFTDEGWIWQNIDVADYMHFDTGYPSTPYQAPNGG